MDDGSLRVYDVKDERALEVLLRHPEIRAGEAETLAAAKELDGLAVIDGEEARALARIHGIRSAPGTIFLLFRLLNLERMDAEEADETLSRLIASGLYLDPKTLIRAKGMLEEYRGRRR